MCQCGCSYEDWSGSCTKRRGIPCPNNEVELDGWEAAQIFEYESRLDMERIRHTQMADKGGYDEDDC